MKYTPNIIVILKAYTKSLRLPDFKLWCAQVTVTPEDNKIIVFNKGTPKALSVNTPTGGHTHPTSGVGTNLLWKKGSKKTKKKTNLWGDK